jgi:flagellar biosynthesis/type III secretory pathway protein FliH
MDTLNRLPWIAQNAVFQRLAEIGEVSALSKEDRIKYDRSLKAFRDAYNTYAWAEKKAMEKGLSEGMEKGMAEGRAKGMAEGRAEGRAEERLANARGLMANNIPLDVIVKSLGLSPEEIEQLSVK